MVMAMVTVSLVTMLALLPIISMVNADLATDRKECTDQLMALATCLQYVSGSAKMPTPDCCGGLKQVLSKSPKCLCILIKDHDDPSLGLKIDPALAMNLPVSCHNAPANVSQCATLLKLKPDSPDAKIFRDFGDKSHGDKTTVGGGSSSSMDADSTTTTTSPTKASSSSGGFRVNIWLLGLKVLGGLFLCYYSFTSHLD